MSAVGLDLLEIERLERALERRPRLAERLFTEAERIAVATDEVHDARPQIWGQALGLGQKLLEPCPRHSDDFFVAKFSEQADDAVAQ